jgi:uncharacterized protein YegJ (DUF2314 family)
MEGNVKSTPLAILLFLSLGAPAGAVEDRTVRVERGDPEMQAATQQAQASLDEFLALKANPPNGASGFKVKVVIRDGSRQEVMWVTPFTQADTGFVGILNDQPEYVTNVRSGQKLNFTRADITDWGYRLNGKQKGSFTVCAIFKHMPPAEVQKYRDDYGFEC